MLLSVPSSPRGMRAIVSSPPPPRPGTVHLHHRFSTQRLVLCLFLFFQCCGLCTFSRRCWQWTNCTHSYNPSGMGVKSPAHFLSRSQFLWKTRALLFWVEGADFKRIMKCILAAPHCSLWELCSSRGSRRRPHPERTLPRLGWSVKHLCRESRLFFFKGGFRIRFCLFMFSLLLM